jgi:propanol-preferring alcohol dehydrogenase
MTEALKDTMKPEILPGKTTYRAVQVVSPGKWELTSKPVVDLPFGHVRIRVETCGVCHSAAATVHGLFPIEWPRVPGHQVVGRIDAIGGHVEDWTVGQRVGVGFLGGSCGHCGERKLYEHKKTLRQSCTGDRRDLRHR